MASLNRIVILGRILGEPETRLSIDGFPVAKFVLPVSSGFNQSAGRIDVVAFRRLAEICNQYFKKDSNVLVEGRLQIRSYEDQTGARKWVTEIVATDIRFADGVQSPVNAVPLHSDDSNEEVPELPEDDLPF